MHSTSSSNSKKKIANRMITAAAASQGIGCRSVQQGAASSSIYAIAAACISGMCHNVISCKRKAKLSMQGLGSKLLLLVLLLPVNRKLCCTNVRDCTELRR